MSAITNRRKPGSSTMPSTGSSVVNGYVAILGRAAEQRESSVLLPALGMPTRPTSAMSLSSRRRFRSWPGLPGSNSRGAWFVEVAKALLPLPPLPPRQTSTFIPGFVEVLEQQVQVGVVDQRSRRDGDDQVLAVGAGHVLALAGLAVLRLPVVPAGEVQQRVLVRGGLEVHVAAVAAVAAVRPAFGDELLPAEAHAAVAAVAGLDVDFGFIDEHRSAFSH